MIYAGLDSRRNGSARGKRVPARRRLTLIRLWLVVLAAALFASTGIVSAQTRDHLTDKETDLVRDNQELDKRIEVFIKAADRRFAIINGLAQPVAKNPAKGDQDWGEPPKGSRAELLGDIAGILDEAITNIEDVSRHDHRNPLISKSLRKLTVAS